MQLPEDPLPGYFVLDEIGNRKGWLYNGSEWVELVENNPKPVDPLHQALVEATLGVLLGSTTFTNQTTDPNGYISFNPVTIPSAFVQRIQTQANQGKYDSLISEAMEKVSSDQVAREFEKMIAEQMIDGLKSVSGSYGSPNKPNWLAVHARSIAVTACEKVLSEDEELLDILRTKIGSEVDRNRVGITVSLSNPETS